MVLLEVEKLLSDLEKTELEANGGVALAGTYIQLLALYLYQNDACNAKYLWKRIPSSIKTNNAELRRVWVVGQRMWKRDWPAVHAALKGEWSEDINEIMTALKESVRDRAMCLISQAYSSLNLNTLAAMTGLTLAETQSAALERGWTVDDGMVQPSRIDKEQRVVQKSLTEDQLYKLTQFVSFLEN